MGWRIRLWWCIGGALLVEICKVVIIGVWQRSTKVAHDHIWHQYQDEAESSASKKNGLWIMTSCQINSIRESKDTSISIRCKNSDLKRN